MTAPKECEKLLELSDAMVQVQGIVRIEHGLRLLQWSKPKELQDHCKAIEITSGVMIKECTQQTILYTGH